MAKKGYWIAHVEITNPERYKDYVAANAAPLKKYGARFLIRNGESQVPRGRLAGRRHVVIEWRSNEPGDPPVHQIFWNSTRSHVLFSLCPRRDGRRSL